MTYEASAPRDYTYVARGRPPREPLPQTALCAVALVAGASIGLGIFYSRPLPAPPVAAPLVARVVPMPSTAATTTAMPSVVAALVPARHPAKTTKRVGLFDQAVTTATIADGDAPALPLGAGLNLFDATTIAPAATPTDVPIAAESPAAVLASAEPPPAEPLAQLPAPQIVAAIPLPQPRPAFLHQGSDVRATVAALTRHDEKPLLPTVPPGDAGGFFDRMFGGTRAPIPALAYAAPDDGDLGRPVAIARAAPDRFTAVYDIAAHTVTLPSGAKLEAHSGLGTRLDNPRSVTEHMRGATPPNVYELKLREAPFHGVRALRLTPTAGTTYGREGLLAHTYMLGPRGDSNGCVVFRNYQAFLQAYESGQVRRLAVVAGAI